MITITDTDIEDTLKSILQQQLCFTINDKKWRNGRLILFKQNGFYIEFVLKNDKNKNEKFEIPIPFEIIRKDNKIYFSYKIDSLICNSPEIVKQLRKLNPSCKSKYYDNLLEIQIT